MLKILPVLQPILGLCAILPGFWEYWEYWEYWENAGKEKVHRKFISLRTQAQKNSTLSTFRTPSSPADPLQVCHSLRLCRKPQRGGRMSLSQVSVAPVGLLLFFCSVPGAARSKDRLPRAVFCRPGGAFSHGTPCFSIHWDESEPEAEVVVPIAG